MQGDIRTLNEATSREARILAEGQQRNVEQYLAVGDTPSLQSLVDQYTHREIVRGLAVYDIYGRTLAITRGLAAAVPSTPLQVTAAMQAGRTLAKYFHSRNGWMHGYTLPLAQDGRQLGALAIFQDAEILAAPVWRHALTSAFQALLIVGVTLLIVNWSLGRPLRHLALWLRDLRTGRSSSIRPAR